MVPLLYLYREDQRHIQRSQVEGDKIVGKITIEQIVAEPWKYNASQWRYAHNIHIPHIAENSPMQYHYLSKSEKRAYDTKREREWQASADGASAWKQAVIGAYDGGDVTTTTPGISNEARTLIISEQAARANDQEREETRQRIEASQYQSLSELQKGQRVFVSHLRHWGEVKRINQKTVTISHPFGDMKVAVHLLYRQDPRAI